MSYLGSRHSCRNVTPYFRTPGNLSMLQKGCATKIFLKKLKFMPLLRRCQVARGTKIRCHSVTVFISAPLKIPETICCLILK
jgi:hypothetical protein